MMKNEWLCAGHVADRDARTDLLPIFAESLFRQQSQVLHSLGCQVHGTLQVPAPPPPLRLLEVSPGGGHRHYEP